MASRADAFEAFDGRLQAHGFYEMQLRALNADYSEEWDASQWYNVFNLELELDLLNETIGPVDMVSAYIRGEVRYDCIYSSGCGMFHSMNTYGDRSRSLPRRLSNATTNVTSGEIPIRQTGRLTGSNTDPVPLSEVAGFSAISQSDGQKIDASLTNCKPGDKPGTNCFPDEFQLGIKPFDYTFEQFTDFRFSMINVTGGGAGGNPVQILGPWLPENRINTTNAAMADRVNPFDNSRLNPVLHCQFGSADFAQPCPIGYKTGDGAKPFRPIPIYAEDRANHGPNKIEVVVYQNDTVPALSDPTNPAVYQTLEIDTSWNGGDARFSPDGTTTTDYIMVRVRFPGDDPNEPPPLRIAYDSRDLTRITTNPFGSLYDLRLPNPNFAVLHTGDAQVVQPEKTGRINSTVPVPDGVSAPTPTTARGLFVPSEPLKEMLESGKLSKAAWPLNLTEDERQWNRGLSQKDEKELKEAYLDIELFDSQLWIRAGKQQIVWGKTELFRTTDQFNPQDLALSTLPSLEEARIALWSVRGIWSFYEVGPVEDVRLELAANIDDYQSSDFGSCGEPYVVNLVCSANFGAFVHGFTGIGIVGVEAVDEPWQSLSGVEVGGRVEWRWDRFSFALSDFWGYADLPAVHRISTYERNTDTQTGRPLVYQAYNPNARRALRQPSYAQDCFVNGAGDCVSNGAGGVTSPWDSVPGSGRDDPWEDQWGDLVALIAAQTANPGGAAAGTLPGGNITTSGVSATTAREALAPGGTSAFLVRENRVNCGTVKRGTNQVRVNTPGGPPGTASGDMVAGEDCLTEGPTQLYNSRVNNANNTFQFGRTDSSGYADPDSLDPLHPYSSTNALDSHHANQTLFAWICSATVGFLEIDTTACAPTVFGSTATTNGIVISVALGTLLAGSPTLSRLLVVDRTLTGPTTINAGSATLEFGLPIVLMSADPGDNASLGCIDYQSRDFSVATLQQPCGGTRTDSTEISTSVLALELSPEQEALLGCGPFWGTNCDSSGIDLLNMEASVVLQSFAGANGTLESIKLKEAGYSFPGTEIIDSVTGLVQPFRAPGEFRTDEGLQPGTLPWEAAGIGGPICTTADIGGDLPNRAGDKITVPTSSYSVQKPGNRKQVLPGCHRKWVDKQNGTLNLAWGEPFWADANGDGNLDVDPATGLPLQARNSSGAVLVDYFYNSGNPDPLGVTLPTPAEQAAGSNALFFPVSTQVQQYNTSNNVNVLYDPSRPAIGAGHPFAGRYAAGARTTNLTIPFANELGALSWNFQMISVGFSAEFRDAVETVGDLADPAGANRKGGTSPANGNTALVNCASSPNSTACMDSIAKAKREVAQMLFGYCGSDYGVIDPATGLGTCRIDTAATAAVTPTNNGAPVKNDVPALTNLYFGLFKQGLFNPTAPPADVQRQRQQILDSLQFVNVRLTERADVFQDISTDFEVNEPAVGENNIIRSEHCSYITPQYCSTVQNLYSLAGVKNRTLASGGNGNYGRRTLQWHSGGEITLYVPKRNVLGFALDFAEDRSKSNFSIETTWIEGEPTGDLAAYDNTTRTDTFNMTVSVDRPTFINFLNPNRTLFINSQWFFQYRAGQKSSFPGNGPFNALATLTVFTGYFQDRLNPSVTFVHDIQSTSGGLLPSVNYRFTENFSATVGMAVFYGRDQKTQIPENGIGPASNEAGDYAYHFGAANGISIVRDRDEVYLRLRYSF